MTLKGGVCLTALLFASAAVAQQPQPPVGTIGLIQKQTVLTVHGKSPSYQGKFLHPGDTCQLLPGDRVTLVGYLADGTALVKQRLVWQDPRKIADRCIVKTLGSIPLGTFNDAAKAEAAAKKHKSSVAQRF